MTRPTPNPQKSINIYNSSKNKIIAESASIAETPKARMIGLLKHDRLLEGEGLIITRCNSIHMFFMRFAIDVIFVGKDDVVVGLVKNIKPWCLSPIFFKAKYVIELPIGVIETTQTSVGDEIAITKT